jgi:hypothetical protein
MPRILNILAFHLPEGGNKSPIYQHFLTQKNIRHLVNNSRNALIRQKDLVYLKNILMKTNRLSVSQKTLESCLKSSSDCENCLTGVTNTQAGALITVLCAHYFIRCHRSSMSSIVVFYYMYLPAPALY